MAGQGMNSLRARRYPSLIYVRTSLFIILSMEIFNVPGISEDMPRKGPGALHSKNKPNKMLASKLREYVASRH
jgi:hypothetical protein